MSRFLIVLLTAILAACGGGGNDSTSCGSASAERLTIEPGIGAKLLAHSIDIAPAATARTVSVSFSAHRLIASESGLDLGPPGATAAYHFLRLYRNGVFSEVIADSDDAALPVAAGACIDVHQAASATFTVSAGESIRVEAVWSVLRPRDAAHDLTAITESLALSVI